jgi:hypothetical protein
MIKSGRGLLEVGVLSRHLPGGTVEIHKKISLRVAGAPFDIRTEYLPNISRGFCHYASLLGSYVREVFGSNLGQDTS